MLRPTRRVASSLAVAAVLASLVGAAPARAADPVDPLVAVKTVTSVVPDAPTPVVDGPFDLVVEVTGGVTDDLTVIPWLPSWSWAPTAPAQTVPAGSCPVSCELTWRIDPAQQGTPWCPGFSRVDVRAAMAGRSVVTYGSAVYYQPTVSPTLATFVADSTPNSPGYTGAVVDTGAQVTFRGAAGRLPDEQVEVLVLPPGGYSSDENRLDLPPLMNAAGTWTTDDPVLGLASGQVHLDTSGLAEGTYRLVAQAHDAAGHYSCAGSTGMVVRHRPLVRLSVDGGGVVATGAPATVRVDVSDPRPSSAALGDLRLTVGGSTTVVPSGIWHRSPGTFTPSDTITTVPTTGLPPGPALLTVDVLDVTGATVGSQTTTLQVADFHDTVTIPTFVVGERGTIRFTASAPSGTTMHLCDVTTTTSRLQYVSPNLCPGPAATSVDGTTSVMPVAAGPATVESRILMDGGVSGPVRRVPVTVYARRTATISAPARAAYGATAVATVVVRDQTDLGTDGGVVRISPAPGVRVTVQRRRAGTSTWSTVGTTVTGSTGVASLRYVTVGSGSLRAVLPAAAPARTVVTAERPVTSVATVAWSTAPTTVRSGASWSAVVITRPYERGATVRLQARRPGATSWVTFAPGAVASSGAARAPARIGTRGTWEIRVLRVGTVGQAVGYSTVRRVKVV
ncbi:MAG: hypothetical protein IE926_09280 [Micrococcales bacterium]|nr:hypothetical protein [Micrococcales bacterium]